MKALAVFSVFSILVIIGVLFIRAHESAPVLPTPIASTTPTPNETSSSSMPVSYGTSTDATSTDLSWTKDFTTITTADVDKTFSFPLHTRFLLKLGGDRTVSFEPTGIVDRVANSISTNGYQGVYEALKEGTTALTAKTARKTFTATIVVTSS